MWYRRILSKLAAQQQQRADSLRRPKARLPALTTIDLFGSAPLTDIGGGVILGGIVGAVVGIAAGFFARSYS